MVKQLFNYVGYLPKPKIIDVPAADKDHDNMLNLSKLENAWKKEKIKSGRVLVFGDYHEG